MNGTITYKGSTEPFKGFTHIAFAAVILYLRANPGASKKEIEDFFMPGLSSYPKKHFLVEPSDYLNLTGNDLKRYVRLDFDSKGDPVKYYVSNFWYFSGNFPKFFEYITSKGFVVKEEKSENAKQTKKPSKRTTGDKPKITQHKLKYGHDDSEWCSNIVRYADGTENKDKVNGLVGFLDDEYRRVEKFAMSFLKDEIKDFSPIFVILSPEMPFDIYDIDDDQRKRMWENLRKRRGGDVTFEDVNDIFRKEKILLPISGIYHRNIPNKISDYSRYIVIYYKNISCSDLEDFKAELAQCLAHEFFHYIHDLNSSCFSNNDFKSKCVIESLADFFAMIYLIDSKESTRIWAAQNRYYDFWEKYFGSNIPYTYALYYFYVNYCWNDFLREYWLYANAGIINKFFWVFDESRSDMEKAFEVLIK